jgi:lipoprotein-releasing system permease protein
MLRLKLALTYLIHKPITLFAVISVLLGTTAFIVVIGVMDGYVSALHEASRTILADMVVTPTRSDYIESADWLGRKVQDEIPEVVACSPNITGAAVIKVRGTDGKFSLKWCNYIGVDAPSEAAVTGIDAFNNVPTDADNWIIVGAGLLSPLDADNTADLTLVTSGRTETSPARRTPVALVSAVRMGLAQYEKEFAYISLDAAARLRGMERTGATSLRIRVAKADQAPAIQKRVQKLLDSLTIKPGMLQVRRYQETMALFQAIESQRSLAVLILMCLFAAAAFAVVAICYMVVLQKIRDIGVLRTIGLSRRDILTTFVTYGAITGLLGAVLGIALGLFMLDHMDGVRQTLESMLGHDPFPVSLYGMAEIPHAVAPSVIVIVVLFAFAISVLGSLYPACRAARLNVVESLRHE